ncbi:MAG: hypothetical protein ACEQSA_01170 [Weeksellaceae bacterium]
MNPEREHAQRILHHEKAPNVPRYPDLPYDERVALPHDQTLDLHRFTRELPNGSRFSGVDYHFGVPIDTDVLEKLVLEITPDATPLGYTGYDRLYRSAKGLTTEEATTQEIDIVTRLALETVEQQGLSLSDISAIYLTSGSPVTPDYASLIADRIGLGHLESFNKQNFYAACNSFGMGMHHLFNRKDLMRKNVLNLNVEGLTRLAPGVYDPDLIDPTAVRMFSNAAAGMIIQPDVNMSVMRAQDGLALSEFHDIQDKDQVLGVVSPYIDMCSISGPQVQSLGDNIHFLRMPLPKLDPQYPDRVINMQAMGTTRFFLKHGKQLTVDFLNRYAVEYPDDPLHFILYHPASLQIVKGQHEGVLKAGHNIPTGWFKVEGNSSGASIPTVLVRAIHQQAIQADKPFALSIAGAGASFTMLALQLGSSQGH